MLNCISAVFVAELLGGLAKASAFQESRPGWLPTARAGEQLIAWPSSFRPPRGVGAQGWIAALSQLAQGVACEQVGIAVRRCGWDAEGPRR